MLADFVVMERTGQSWIDGMIVFGVWNLLKEENVFSNRTWHRFKYLQVRYVNQVNLS